MLTILIPIVKANKLAPNTPKDHRANPKDNKINLILNRIFLKIKNQNHNLMTPLKKKKKKKRWWKNLLRRRLIKACLRQSIPPHLKTHHPPRIMMNQLQVSKHPNIARKNTTNSKNTARSMIKSKSLSTLSKGKESKQVMAEPLPQSKEAVLSKSLKTDLPFSILGMLRISKSKYLLWDLFLHKASILMLQSPTREVAVRRNPQQEITLMLERLMTPNTMMKMSIMRTLRRSITNSRKLKPTRKMLLESLWLRVSTISRE